MKKEIALLLLIVLLLLSIVLPQGEIFGQLAMGWVDFIGRGVRGMRMRWEVVWSVAICAVALVWGGHYFARWLYREAKGELWKWGWTLRAFALFVLMFVAGTAAVAVVQQSAWIINDDRPMYKRVPYCSSHLRQIGQGLLLYAQEHQGKLPDDLAQLIVDAEIDSATLCCPATQQQPANGKTREEIAANIREHGHCSYLYLGKGMAEPIHPEAVLVYEELANHGGEGMNVLYGDGHVEWIGGKAARELFQQLNAGKQPTTHSTTREAR